MGVVVVCLLNHEFKSIQSEAKNEMVSGLSCALAKMTLVTPIMLVFAVCLLGVSCFAIMNVPAEAAKRAFFNFAALMFVCESMGEVLAVAVENPIMGLLCCMMASTRCCKLRCAHSQHGLRSCSHVIETFLFAGVGEFFGRFLVLFSVCIFVLTFETTLQLF